MRQGMPTVLGYVFNKACEILTRNNRTDWARENVIKKKSRYRELSQRATHRLFDDAVNAAASEHAAGLDIKSPHRIAEQHDRQNEPGSALADDLLSVAAGVIRGGCQVRQDDGSSPPERDKGQHHRGGDEDLYCRFSLNGGSHASGGERN